MALATTLPAGLGLLIIHRQRHADTELAPYVSASRRQDRDRLETFQGGPDRPRDTLLATPPVFPSRKGSGPDFVGRPVRRISLCWRNLRISPRLFSSSTREETNMRLTTIAVATAFALSSTFALAEENPATGAQGGATGVPGVKTNPTPEQASQGGATGVPGAKTEPTPDQATSTTDKNGTATTKSTTDPTTPEKKMTK